MQLTTNDLVKMFGVSSVCISDWRKGTATKAKLPIVPQKAGERAVRFKSDVVVKWAEKHGVKIKPGSMPAETPMTSTAAAITKASTQRPVKTAAKKTSKASAGKKKQ